MTDEHAADERWMLRALELARRGGEAGEVPVGAVLVDAGGEFFAEGWNQPISACDPTAHAEIVALRCGAQRAGNYRLPGTTLYVTLEPCLMCCGALVHARVSRVVYGASEPKSGAVESAFSVLGSSALNHQVQISGGVLAETSSDLLQNFFAKRRQSECSAQRRRFPR